MFKGHSLQPGQLHMMQAETACCCPRYVLNVCRALEAVGLAAKGCGGHYVQQTYDQLVAPLGQQQPGHHQAESGSSSNSRSTGQHPTPLGDSSAARHPGHHAVWPVNTHGGLLGFGAPWEVPAMISLVEAVTQLRGEALGRQVPDAHRALVYGNGGIFSASAVAILQAVAERRSGEQSCRRHRDSVRQPGYAANSRL